MSRSCVSAALSISRCCAHAFGVWFRGLAGAVALALGLACAAVVTLPERALAQQAAPAKAAAAKTAFECRWCDVPPVLDGKADEAVWAKAEVVDGFYLPWTAAKTLAKTKTKARLLWDAGYLYFFSEMDDADLYADVTEDDGQLWDNDVFELFFKPSAKHPGYFEFQVNPAGAKLDMFLPRRGAGGYNRFKKSDDFHLEAKVVRDGTLNNANDRDKGWSVEGRIPWTDFLKAGGRPAADEVWKFALCRYDYSVDFEGPDLSTCAPLTERSFHNYEGYADLKFIPRNDETALKPFGIDKLPAWTTSKVVGSPEPPLPYRAVRTLAKLSLPHLLYVETEPETKRLMFLDQGGATNKFRLCRVKGDPAGGEFDVLHELKATCYSFAFHPQYAKNGYLYLGEQEDKMVRITRYTIDRKVPFGVVADSRTLIVEWPSNGHNGAAVTFGHDGMLYITSGDGTSDSDPDLIGQGLDHLLSKVLRIDVDHPDKDRPYSVPKDNPFVAMKEARPETWAYGFRNPWRMATDRETGHIWVGNNGQDLWEQAYLVQKGANYGWSVYEGSYPFYLTRKMGPTPLVAPTVEHSHSEARSLTGGIVYYGTKYPELRGHYIYGDYSTGKIWAVKHDGKTKLAHREIADTTLQISGFGADAEGELLICDYRKPDGGFYTLEPIPPVTDPVPFPAKLSQTGLFEAVAGHVLKPGVIPYSVNAPLWSDNAHKARFMAIPPVVDGEGNAKLPTVNFDIRRSWNLPEKTVLVKSFAYDAEEGNAASRRWVETRLLTKQEGEWVGYSYIWNDEQTEATLVAKEGLDRVFPVKSAQGNKEWKWRYPSRTECMVCHSRAANYVLGVSLAQLNREHDYNGIVDHQFRVFEHIGLIKFNPVAEIPAMLRTEHTRKTGEPEKEFRKLTAPGQRPIPASKMLPLAPEFMPRLSNPYDTSLDLNERARSYLHANCAQCHVEAGGGNAQFDLDYFSSEKKTKLFNVDPLHHKFGITNPKLIAPGDPARSVLLHRVQQRGPASGQMPQLATHLIDEPAAAMLREWIAKMPAEKFSPPDQK